MVRGRRAFGLLAALAAVGASACTSSPPPTPPAAPAGQDIARGFDVGGRQVYLECQAAHRPANPRSY